MPSNSYQSLEDVVGKYLDKYPTMHREQALAAVQAHFDSGDPRITGIPNITDDLRDAQMVAKVAATEASLFQTATAPLTWLAGKALLAAPDDIRRKGESWLDALKQNEESAESASPVGSLIGNVGGFMTSGGPGAVGDLLGKVPVVRALPKLARAGLGGYLTGKVGALGDQNIPIPFTGREATPSAAGAVFGVGGEVAGSALERLANLWGGATKTVADAQNVLAPEDQAATSQPVEAGSGTRSTSDAMNQQSRASADSLTQGATVPDYQPPEDWLAAQQRKADEITAQIDRAKYQRQLRKNNPWPVGEMRGPLGHAPGPQDVEPFSIFGGPTRGPGPGDLEPEPTGSAEMRGPGPEDVERTPTLDEEFESVARQQRQAAAAAPIAPPKELTQPTAWFEGATQAEKAKATTPQVKLARQVNEPTGTATMRAGQPFTAESHNVVDAQREGLKVWAEPESKLGKLGKPGKVKFTNPLIVETQHTGPQAFVDVAKQLWSRSPKTIAMLDAAKDQVGMAQELIARSAQRGGYDAVSISTPKLEDNVMIDLRDFKPTRHAEEWDIQRTPGHQVQGKGATGGKPQGPFRLPPGVKPEGGPQAVSGKLLDELRKAASGAEDAIPEREASEAGFDRQSRAALHDDVSRMGPEWTAASHTVNEASLEPLARFRPIAFAIDHPDFHGAMGKALKAATDSDKLIKRTRDAFAAIEKTVPKGEFDELHRALTGLTYDDNDKLVQTAVNVDGRHDAAARLLLNNVVTPAYEYLTNVDMRAALTMRRFGLAFTRKQFERLRLIQAVEDSPEREKLFASRTPPTREELIVADRTKGMLNYDDTHDLTVEPGKGFLSFYAVENEREKVLDAIKFLEGQKAAGYAPTGHASLTAMLDKYQKRLEWIDSQIEHEEKRPLPSRDYVPRHKEFAPLKASTDSAARPLWPEMDVEKLFGKYIAGVADKRQSDVVLSEVRRLLKHPDFQDAYVKNYLTDWGNAVRGSRGHWGDRSFANAWNTSLGRAGAPKVTASQVHSATSFVMNGMSWTKLFLSPVRFPFINLTHLFTTLYPVVGEKTFARAFAEVLANPKRWFAEAADAGAIRGESDWLREVADPQTTAVKGRWARKWLSATYATENFRRAVAYRAGLLTEPADRSVLVKAFDRRPGAYATPLEESRAYARGLTLTTQFETSMINKPLHFSGNPLKRLVAQFRTWPSSLGSLYADMLKQKQWGSLVRGMATLSFFGGLPAVMGGPEIYGRVRDHVLRETGQVLPDQTGMQYAVDALGFQGTPIGEVLGANLYSLHDPFALVPPNTEGLLGPSIGTVVSTIRDVDTAAQNEDYDGVAKAVLGGVSPQARALIEGADEFFNDGKIFGANGQLEMQRPYMARWMRGLDMVPSARSIHYQDMHDLASAVESGNQATVQQLRQKAMRDGVVLNKKFWDGVKQIVKSRSKRHTNTSTIWSQL